MRRVSEILNERKAVNDMIEDLKHFTWIKEMPETVKVEDMQEFQDDLDYHFEHKLGYTESFMKMQ